MIRMPGRHVSLEVYRACPNGRRPRGRSSTCWRDYIFNLAWEYSGITEEGVENIVGERDVWTTFLSLLPHQPGPR